MKDYNTNMAIDIPNNEKVRMVQMGECVILDDTNKEHLLTFGLGPCVGASIVTINKDGETKRLLAHIDMGQILGISFEHFSKYLKGIESSASKEANDIVISLTSTESYLDMNNLKENEIRLLSVILNSFKTIGIELKDIEFNNSSQVQISPQGITSTYSDYELNQHREHMMQELLTDFGGHIDPNLDIYITEFGAYTGNYSLNIDCSEEEKNQLLTLPYYQKLISEGYELTVAPSFNDPSCLAVYVKNWDDPTIQKYGTVPGCVTAKKTHSRFR